MPRLDDSTIVGVLGAGAMGSGIAQVAAIAGHRVVLDDTSQGALDSARERLDTALRREEEKKRIPAGQAKAILDRVLFGQAGDALDGYRDCGLVIEAIVERLDAKRTSFSALERVVATDCVLATNTSSLSIASIAGGFSRP